MSDRPKVDFRDSKLVFWGRRQLYRFGLRPKEGSFWFSYYLDYMWKIYDKQDKQPIRHGKKR